MKIAVDGRGVYWYRGTGMGTYTGALWKILELYKKEAAFYTPVGWEFGTFDIPQDQCCERRDFWEMVSKPPPTIPRDCTVFHNPYHGFGMPSCKIPSVVTVHDVIPLVMPQVSGSPYREMFAETVSRGVRRADSVIAVSQWTKNDLLERFPLPEEKIIVIPEFADEIFQPLPQETVKSFLKESYGIERPYVLYVGGFGLRKNVAALIRAFATVASKYPDELLVISGKEGKNSEALKKLGAELQLEGRIHFLGYVPRNHLPFFYNGADIFVYPSLYEGFGLPPLEAASCGKAIITSNTSSIPEMMGEGALLIDPSQGNELEDALDFLLQHESQREHLGRLALARAEIFTMERMAEQTLAVYENLCR